LTNDISCGIIPVDDITINDIEGKYMAREKELFKTLPLTEATSYILLALAEPLHGYGVMQKIEQLSEGTVNVGPGTLYGAFSALEKDGLIIKVSEEERRKSYTLTPKGRKILQEHMRRLGILVRHGRILKGD
jgi:DNA-binding PadR family transcriptional regulator